MSHTYTLHVEVYGLYVGSNLNLGNPYIDCIYI